MATAETTTIDVIPSEIMAELLAAAKRAANGIRDPEIMRQACARMDHMREEIRKKHGDLQVVVDLIREVREDA